MSYSNQQYQQYQQQSQQSPIIVNAIPINENSQPVQVNSTPYNIIVEPTNQAICRGCGRQFTREPGVHDGQAQYYRCEDCNSLTNVFLGSCVVQ